MLGTAVHAIFSMFYLTCIIEQGNWIVKRFLRVFGRRLEAV